MGKKKIVGVCGGDPRTDYIKLSLEKRDMKYATDFPTRFFIKRQSNAMRCCSPRR